MRGLLFIRFDGYTFPFVVFPSAVAYLAEIGVVNIKPVVVSFPV